MKTRFDFYYLKSFIPITLCTLTVTNLQAAPDQHINEIDQQREAIVISINQGNVDAGITELRKLLEKAPNNQKLIADYLLLALQNKRYLEEDQKLLQHIQPEHFPVYAQLPLIKAYRDKKQFPIALNVLNLFQNKNNSSDLEILKAVLLAENQQKAEAIAQLKKIDIEQLNHDQLNQLSYAYRISDQPIQALAVIRKSNIETANTASEQEYLNVLMVLGAYQQVLTLIQKNPALDSTHAVKRQALLGQFSESIKNAIKSQKHLAYQGEADVQSYAQLDEVLKHARVLDSELKQDPNLYRRFQYEYIYALSYRSRHQDVLEVSRGLGLQINEMPAYVRHSIADAYLSTQQPARAEQVYKSLLTEKNYADMNVYTSLYYALIEQEDYEQANALIKDIDSKMPTFQYSLAKGVDKRVHPERNDYENLKALSFAYSNDLNAAEQNLNQKIQRAPNNEEVINNLVRIQRWREKPLQAEETLGRLNGIQPLSKSTLINQMQNQQALGNISAWRDQTNQLNQRYPTDTSVIKSNKELADRERFSISHDSRFSHSEANQNQVLESLKGTRDFESITRLNGPWVQDNYRIFTQYKHRMGDYRDGKIRDERLGIGAEWDSKQKSFSFMASQDLNGDHFGFDVNWNHRLDDYWRYNLGFSTQSDIPLQALKLNEDAQSYTAGLSWQANESKQASLQYQATDISDGNLRQELSARYQQNMFMQPHHKTQFGISSYLGRNSLDQTSYFSPKESISVGVDFNHDWLTWREYEQSLTQKFSLTTGFYKQNQFDAEPVVDIRYGHQWQLTRTWGLQYGVGWGMHPYDGEKEKKWYGQLGFEGKF